MAYTSDKKPGALTAATVLANTDNVVVEQSGDVKRATLAQVEAKIFDAKTGESTPTGTEVVVIRKTDNTLRQVALSDIVPTGNITNAKVSGTAAIADTKLATIATAGKVLNSATTATFENTINAIVARDGSGNFSAGTITATLAGSITGNAATANTAVNLSSNRTFALTGNVTGSTSSNLSSGVSVATTIPTGTVTSAMIADGTIVDADINESAAIADTKLATINTAGKVTNNAVQAVSTNTANQIVTRDASGNFAAGTITANLTGTASAIADGTVSTSKIVDANVTAVKVAPVEFNTQTASYTVTASDSNKVILMNVASPNTVTLPVGLPVGTQVTVIQIGAGQTTFAASGGASLRTTDNFTKLYKQWSVATALYVSVNNWVVAGDLI